jgi:hypothetical protein
MLLELFCDEQSLPLYCKYLFTIFCAILKGEIFTALPWCLADSGRTISQDALLWQLDGLSSCQPGCFEQSMDTLIKL